MYAIGGNALAPPGGASGDEHAMILAQVMSDVVDLLEADWSVVLTHGNGPQVGKLMSMDVLLESEQSDVEGEGGAAADHRYGVGIGHDVLAAAKDRCG